MFICKKLISLLICVCIACSVVIAGYSETATLTSGDFEYVLSQDGTAEITGYKGNERNLIVPNTLDNHPVKKIGDSVFEGSSEFSFENVIIQDGIEEIGNKAFQKNGLLHRVGIPSSVKIIGDRAFSFCDSLTGEPNASDEVYSDLYEEIKKKEGKVNSAETQLKRWIDGGKKSEADISKQREKVQSLKEELAALEEKLSSNSTDLFVIPAGTTLLTDGLEYIGDYSFERCRNLGFITIPDTVKSIGVNPFNGCSNLQVNVSPKHPALAVKYGVLFSKSDKRLVIFTRDAKEYEIPQGILCIDDCAFSNCKIQKIVMPDSVISIGIAAFYGTDLKQINIPDSVTIIGISDFGNCSNLSSVEIGCNVTSIGKQAFEHCYKIRELSIPESVKDIGEEAFPPEAVLVVIPDSIAETYCKENGVNYKYAESDMDWLLD